MSLNLLVLWHVGAALVWLTQPSCPASAQGKGTPLTQSSPSFLLDIWAGLGSLATAILRPGLVP